MVIALLTVLSILMEDSSMFDLAIIVRRNYTKHDGSFDRKAYLRDTRETRKHSSTSSRRIAHKVTKGGLNRV